MTAIVTSGTRIFNAEQVKNSFANSLPDKNYLFIAKSTPWQNDAAPPMPVDSYLTDTEVRRDILAMKRISEGDVSLGIVRRDWVSNRYWDIYRHDWGEIGVTGLNPITGEATTPLSYLEANHYCVTDDFNVYMCLWNGGGVLSTVKPTGTSSNKLQTADGYIWKYMYTISPADALKFVSSNFIPVRYVSESPSVADPYYSQWEVQESAVAGTLERILVKDGGSGYAPSSTFSITIVGNGSGAVATATTNSSGSIVYVNVTSIGAGYTWASVTASGGTGAVFNPIIAPRGGYGSNAAVQLGGNYTLISSYLAFDEGLGDFPTINEYRRIGILKSPLAYGTSNIATGLTLDGTTKITMAAGGIGTFIPDEEIVGSGSQARATVVSYDSNTRILKYIQIGTQRGSFSVADTISGLASGAAAAVSSIAQPEVDVNSGELIYLEHRRPVHRQPDQMEAIKIVIES